MHPRAEMGIIFFCGRAETPILLLKTQRGAEVRQLLWGPGHVPPTAGLTQPHSPTAELGCQAAHAPCLSLEGDGVSVHTALEAAPGSVLDPREATTTRSMAEQPLPEKKL